MKNMKRIHYIAAIIALMAGLLATSCTDEELIKQTDRPNGVDMSRMVEVTLPFRTGEGISTIVNTRNATDTDCHLSGIMVFVYANNGDDATQNERVAWYLFGNPDADNNLENSTGGWTADNDDPHCGNIKLHLPVGDCFIYLIGNAQGSFLDFFSKINQGTGQADPDSDPLATQQDFFTNAAPKWTGSLYSVDGYLPLSGMVNNDRGNCTVNANGTITYKDNEGTQHTLTTVHNDQNKADETNSFVLKRMMSKVTVKINGKEGVTFKPRDFRFRHVAQYVSPSATAWSDEQRAQIPVVDTDAQTFTPQSPNEFTVYLPESVWETSGLTSFAEREAVEKETNGENKEENGHYVFTNAPQNATYLEITGDYEGPGDARDGTAETTVSATTRYFIHLGNFGETQGYNDFSLRRDHHYTYNITVSGVNSIYAEVNVEGGESGEHPEAPGAESIIFEGGARARLDAHYEQVEMMFDSENLENGIYIYADTPYGAVSCKYNPSATDGNKYTEGSVTQDEFIKHTQWIEFAQQNEKGKLAKYPGTGKCQNIFQALDAAYNATDKSYYTCFVNEYYYEKDPRNDGNAHLKDFINAPDRTFSLGSSLFYSPDGKSAIAKAVYVLQQRSIACFYDLNDNTLNKYGVETVDEMANATGATSGITTTGNSYGHTIGLGGGSVDPATKRQAINKGYPNTVRDLTYNIDGYNRNWEGKSGKAKELYKKVNWEKNGFLLDEEKMILVSSSLNDRMKDNDACKACLARNRDLDGDGDLEYTFTSNNDNDGAINASSELRWYTPSFNQVIGLFIGEPILPAEAYLFPYTTDVLTGNSTTCKYPVFTSTPDHEHLGSRVIWAEQGCVSSKNSNYDGYIRAVRNLGSGEASANSHATPPDDFFTYNKDTRVITLHLAEDARRKGFAYRELAPHNERDEQNHPYKTFQVAIHPFVEKKFETCTSSRPDCGTKVPYNSVRFNGAATANAPGSTLAQSYSSADAVHAADEPQTDYDTFTTKGDWRLPNQRELALMISALGIELGYKEDNTYRATSCSIKHSSNTSHTVNYNKDQPLLHCRTTFSKSGYSYNDYGFMFDTDANGVRLFSSSNGTNGNAGYYCVRDVNP